jgi:hypothetical protein
VLIDESGHYIITVGGIEKVSIALWSLKELVDEAKRDKLT